MKLRDAKTPMNDMAGLGRATAAACSSLRLLLVASALVLASCGGSSEDPELAPAENPADGGGSASADAPDPHSGSLEILRAKYATMPQTDPAAEALALLRVVQTLPDVSESGITTTGDVWLTFDDGIPAVISFRPMLDDGSDGGFAPANAAVRAAQALDAKLPGSRSAFLVEATGFKGNLYGHSRIKDWLTDQGFSVSMLEGAVGPDSLRTIRNASVVGVSMHGGTGLIRGWETFIMATGLQRNLANVLAYWTELHNGQMGYILVWPPNVKRTTDFNIYWNLFITPAFVRKNMSFANGSVVYLGVCDSFTPIAADMRQAFLDAGASVVLGWDAHILAHFTVSSEGFFFDRLLSANSFEDYKIDPGNRPFPVREVYADMTKRQRLATTYPPNYPPDDDARTLAAGPDEFTKFASVARLFVQYAKGYEGMALAPAITGLKVDNVLDQLILTGHFGDGPGKGGGTRTVTLDKQALNVLSWSDSTIVTNMVPREGAGSGGELRVNVDGAKSNPAWVNQWNGVVLRNYTPADARAGTGAGTATTLLQCTVNLRGSDTGFRAELNGPTTLWATTDEAVVGTGDCMWDAYGTDDKPTYTNTYAVAGPKGLPWVNPPQRAFTPSFARYAWVSASINSGRASFTMLGGVNPSDGGGLLQTFIRKSDGVSAQSTSLFSSSGNTDNVTAGFFDVDDSLKAGSAQQTLNLLGWGGSTSMHLPEPINYSR